jgi:tryptophan synthase beta chain
MSVDIPSRAQSPLPNEGFDPDETGHWGRFGGRFVPEALVAALDELNEAFRQARIDPDFIATLAHLQRTYTGRPSPLTEANCLRARGRRSHPAQA